MTTRDMNRVEYSSVMPALTRRWVGLESFLATYISRLDHGESPELCRPSRELLARKSPPIPGSPTLLAGCHPTNLVRSWCMRCGSIAQPELALVMRYMEHGNRGVRLIRNGWDIRYVTVDGAWFTTCFARHDL